MRTTCEGAYEAGLLVRSRYRELSPTRQRGGGRSNVLGNGTGEGEEEVGISRHRCHHASARQMPQPHAFAPPPCHNPVVSRLGIDCSHPPLGRPRRHRQLLPLPRDQKQSLQASAGSMPIWKSHIPEAAQRPGLLGRVGVDVCPSRLDSPCRFAHPTASPSRPPTRLRAHYPPATPHRAGSRYAPRSCLCISSSPHPKNMPCRRHSR